MANVAISRSAVAARSRGGVGTLLTPLQLRFLLSLGAAGAALVALKSFVLDPLTGHFGGPFEDFAAYIGAARSMAHGGSPYAQFSSATPVMSGFTYPPFGAVLVRPLAVLGDHAALSVWLAISLACTVAAAVIVVRTALPARWPRLQLAVLAALAFAPAAYNYWHGQINGVILLLLSVAYWGYVRDRRLTVGIALGVAAGIKVAPVVLLLLLLRRGWWRSAAAMLATVAATVVTAIVALGPATTATFVSTVLPVLSRANGWLYDQSLTGLVSRVANQSVLVVHPVALTVSAACTLAGAAVLAAALLTAQRSPRSDAERGAEFGMGVTAMLLAGSIAWFPHFTALVIPLFATAGLVASRGWRTERRLLAASVTALIVFGVVAPFGIAAMTMPGLIALSASPLWWPFLQLCSLPCLSALWLFVELCRSLRVAPGVKKGRAARTARPPSRKEEAVYAS